MLSRMLIIITAMEKPIKYQRPNIFAEYFMSVFWYRSVFIMSNNIRKNWIDTSRWPSISLNLNSSLLNLSLKLWIMMTGCMKNSRSKIVWRRSFFHLSGFFWLIITIRWYRKYSLIRRKGSPRFLIRLISTNDDLPVRSIRR